MKYGRGVPLNVQCLALVCYEMVFVCSLNIATQVVFILSGWVTHIPETPLFPFSSLLGWLRNLILSPVKNDSLCVSREDQRPRLAKRQAQQWVDSRDGIASIP